MGRVEQEFVERWSRILAAEGLPPFSGRLWAWLLVCEPTEQTVEQIAEAIGASRGAISGAVRWLEPSGLIHRSRRAGDRRDYWSTTPDAMIRVIENRQRQMRPSLDTLEAAITGLADRPPGSLDRLRDVHALYQVLFGVVGDAAERYKEHRAAETAGVPAGKD